MSSKSALWERLDEVAVHGKEVVVARQEALVRERLAIPHPEGGSGEGSEYGSACAVVCDGVCGDVCVCVCDGV